MDIFNAIRSVIFFIAGLLTIIFRKQLNNFKNHMLKKLHFEKKIKDERKSYVYMGIVFVIISIILVIFAINK